jgi:hypothetical protein
MQPQRVTPAGIVDAQMERTAWTDERLDDFSHRMDAGFERVDRDIRDLRTEMREGFGGVRAEMRDEFTDVRTEVRDEFTAVRTEMREGFAAVRTEMRDGFADVRAEMRAEFAAVREDIASMQGMMWRFGGAMIATFGAGLVAVAVRGG